MRVLHRLLGRFRAGKRGLQAVIERLGDALVLVRRQLRGGEFELVARDRRRRKVGEVLLHHVGVVGVGAYRHIAGVGAPLRGALGRGRPLDELERRLLLGRARLLGDVEVATAGQVVKNWDAIKKQEKINAGKDVIATSLLDGVPQASPALFIAQEYDKRSRKTGFKYHHIDEVYAKIAEEIKEVQEATTPEHQREELGDLLLCVVCLATMLKIDAEAALRAANRKYKKRFQVVEDTMRADKKHDFSEYTQEEQDAVWQKAKAAAKGEI